MRGYYLHNSHAPKEMYVASKSFSEREENLPNKNIIYLSAKYSSHPRFPIVENSKYSRKKQQKKERKH